MFPAFFHRLSRTSRRGQSRRATPTRWQRSQLRLVHLEDRTVPSSVWYVNAAATGAKTGMDWADAFTNPQSALAAANPGDEVWVAAGTYKPAAVNDRTASFVLKDGVGVYGGFAGTETARSQRDWVAHPTILSGEIGNPTTTTDNSYHVVIGSGVTATAALDGFTVTAGNAGTALDPSSAGAGLYIASGSPTLANLTVSNNLASMGGGGININAGSPTLTNVIFTGDNGGRAGGLSNENGSPTLTNVTFTGNHGGQGGAMYMNNANGGSTTLTNVTFSGNTGDVGGGLDSEYGSGTLTNITIAGNSADFGGGLAIVNSSVILTNVTIAGNSAVSGPGGLELFGGSTLTNVTIAGNTASAIGGLLINGSPTLTNVTVTGNSAGSDGGVAVINSGAPVLTNVTIAGNTAVTGGTGGIYVDPRCTATLTNCIVWGNTAPSAPSINGSPTVNYSDVQYGYEGTGNINADPLFANPTGGDYHLRPGSPAIDAGTNTGAPTTDRDGVPRPFDGNNDGTATTDMGAYEYQGVRVAGVQVNDGSAQRSEVRSIQITFSAPVTFANGNAAAAFQLTHVPGQYKRQSGGNRFGQHPRRDGGDVDLFRQRNRFDQRRPRGEPVVDRRPLPVDDLQRQRHRAGWAGPGRERHGRQQLRQPGRHVADGFGPVSPVPPVRRQQRRRVYQRR